MAYYDAVIVKELSDRYEPVPDHFDNVSRSISLAFSGFDSISIGWVTLTKRDQMGTFLKSIRKVQHLAQFCGNLPTISCLTLRPD